MYLQYWGLNKHAFHNVPDPGMYFEMHQSVENAVAEILFAVEEGDECLAVVVGEVGLGKTMSLRVVLDSLGPEQYRIAFISNPDLTFPQLLREIVGQLTDSQCEIKTKDRLLEEFNRILVETNREGKKVIIFIDEGNAIRKINLESLRLLTNLQADDHNLFTLVLAGQPELAQRLEQPSMANLYQRIGVYCKLTKIESRDVLKDYIEHRCERAGATRPIFSEDAIDRIWLHSEEGVPRLVNRICKLAMKAGETNRLEIIDGEVIDAVANRFIRCTQKNHQFQPPSKPRKESPAESHAEMASPPEPRPQHGPEAQQPEPRPSTPAEPSEPVIVVQEEDLPAHGPQPNKVRKLFGDVLGSIGERFHREPPPQLDEDPSASETTPRLESAEAHKGDPEVSQTQPAKTVVKDDLQEEDPEEFSKKVIDMMKDRYRANKNIGILY